VLCNVAFGTVQDKDMAEGLVYPKLERIRDISAQIAAKVAQCAIDEVGSDGPHRTLALYRVGRS
jgi:hypothetical protein